MKTKLIASCIAMTVAADFLSYDRLSQDSMLTDIQLANIEALAQDTETPPSNTGPKEEKKCYKGGHRTICLCINNHPCTESDCY